jgi:hypothetical protein
MVSAGSFPCGVVPAVPSATIAYAVGDAVVDAVGDAVGDAVVDAVVEHLEQTHWWRTIGHLRLPMVHLW